MSSNNIGQEVTAITSVWAPQRFKADMWRMTIISKPKTHATSSEPRLRFDDCRNLELRHENEHPVKTNALCTWQKRKKRDRLTDYKTLKYSFSSFHSCCAVLLWTWCIFIVEHDETVSGTARQLTCRQMLIDQMIPIHTSVKAMEKAPILLNKLQILCFIRNCIRQIWSLDSLSMSL